tara:strand:+ start:1069 stop:1713 length:645 start_codon:yes stop_codon:yes gene_type:complete
MHKELQKRILSSIVIIPVSFFFILKGSLPFIFFLTALLILTSYEWIRMNTKIIIKVTGILFLFYSFTSAYLLRENFGSYLFITVIVICICTDIGGYTFGKLFKGPKLTNISPNKTYSGMFGSFLIPMLFFLILNKYYDRLNSFITIFSNDYHLDLLFIFLFSALSQAGDLFISYFKRLAKVKNTGNFLPGHGGILDRIDGIIFVIPISYLIFNI